MLQPFDERQNRALRTYSLIMLAELGETSFVVDAVEQPSEAAQRWRRLVRSLRRLRRLQRFWGLLGGVLRAFPASLRDRLRAVDGERGRDPTGLR